MRGFKGFDPDLKCRDFPYEVSQSYSHDGPIGLCQQGFHFCERLRDCFEFYDPDNGNRFCEVEAWEDIESDGKKSVAKNIEIIRELMPVEINRAKYGNGNGYGYGYGDGYGDGYGYGNGYGYGYGYGYGDGYGDGYGYGNGYGYGYGDGYGNGYGYGYGNGNGYGYGYGDGYGDGYGYGNGYGNGNGYGYGYGDGNGTRINEILLYTEEENT